mmetsp:Transcript_10670/g.21127  ORF Transcript_10670/g.21127 Transcript_10670/m.21127 type:complete len:217 (+) Transcript_10670:165-815(+)
MKHAHFINRTNSVALIPHILLQFMLQIRILSHLFQCEHVFQNHSHQLWLYFIIKAFPPERLSLLHLCNLLLPLLGHCILLHKRISLLLKLGLANAHSSIQTISQWCTIQYINGQLDTRSLEICHQPIPFEHIIVSIQFYPRPIRLGIYFNHSTFAKHLFHLLNSNILRKPLNIHACILLGIKPLFIPGPCLLPLLRSLLRCEQRSFPSYHIFVTVI